jgi:hypothetical protein
MLLGRRTDGPEESPSPLGRNLAPLQHVMRDGWDRGCLRLMRSRDVSHEHLITHEAGAAHTNGEVRRKLSSWVSECSAGPDGPCAAFQTTRPSREST